MGAWGARKAALVVTNTRRVLAMELLAGAQGLEFLRPRRSTQIIEKVHHLIRKRSARLHSDRSLHEDIKAVEELILTQQIEEVLN